MDLLIPVLLIGGLVALTLGADLLVRGAARIATYFGMPSLVVGLTIVAFGTSAPELAISMDAAHAGNADIALANVIGSNVFNVLFILGACAAITPLMVAKQLVRFDVPVMVGASLLTWWMAADGHIGRVDGAVLVTLFIAYTVITVRNGLRDPVPPAAASHDPDMAYDASEKDTHALLKPILWLLVGLVLLVLGAHGFVDGAVRLARFLGVSDAVIGLTIVAVGTSLPEVATSIIATLRNERDIAVGNVVGSNISNLLLILGATSLTIGLDVEQSLMALDIIVMVVVALVCLPIFYTALSIERWEGVLLITAYLIYTVWLVLHATNSAFLPAYTALLLHYMLPAMGMLLAGHALHQLIVHRRDFYD